MLPSVVSLAIIIAAAFVFRWLAKTSRWRIISDDTCAKCGYLVIGLPGKICPECGSNLAATGAILRKGAKPPLPRELAVIVWSFAFGAADIAINTAWLDRLPQVSIHKYDCSIGRPRSGAYTSIRFEYNGESYRNSPLSGQVRITLTDNSGREQSLDADAVTGSSRSATSPPMLKSENGLSSDAILKWMENCGVDVKTPGAAEEAKFIVTAINRAAVGNTIASPAFSFTSTTGSREFRTTRLIDAAQWSMVLVWGLGCVLLWRRRASNH